MPDDAMPAQSDAESRGLRDRLRAIFVRLTKWYLGGTEFFWGFSDVAIRFFVAIYFLRSGIVKALDWDTAVTLATLEYRVSWMEPVTAAWVGLGIELVATSLFLIGLLTRPAAAAMAALTIISQIVYTPTTSNLLIVAILIFYVLAGPARFSLDHLLTRRWQDEGPAPFRAVIRLAAWIRDNLVLAFMALTRVWLGMTLLVYADLFDPSIAVRTWLPTTIFMGFPDWLAIASASLLFIGFAAGPMSYFLFFLIGALMIAGAHPNVTLFPFLYLSIYEAKGAGTLSVDRAILAWLERTVLRPEDESDQALGAQAGVAFPSDDDVVMDGNS